MLAKLLLTCTALALPPAAIAAAPVKAPATAKAAAFAPTRFSVVVEGSGPDVILIPGLASPRAVWNGARPALVGYRRHLVQLNGFGGTAPGVNANGAILAPAVAELTPSRRAPCTRT